MKKFVYSGGYLNSYCYVSMINSSNEFIQPLIRSFSYSRSLRLILKLTL